MFTCCRLGILLKMEVLGRTRYFRLFSRILNYHKRMVSLLRLCSKSVYFDRKRLLKFHVLFILWIVFFKSIFLFAFLLFCFPADRYLSSEVSIFFELRVRYLVACERLPEAIALAKRCSQHSVVGRHLYFMQAYLTCLWRASFHECFDKEVSDFSKIVNWKFTQPNLLLHGVWA